MLFLMLQCPVFRHHNKSSILMGCGYVICNVIISNYISLIDCTYASSYGIVYNCVFPSYVPGTPHSICTLRHTSLLRHRPHLSSPHCQLPVHFPQHLLVSQFTCLPSYQKTCLSTFLPVNAPTFQTTYLSIYLSIC